MKKIFAILVGVVPYLLPQPAFAHAFGKLYSLPVPFWMYLYGGAAAIVISFLVIGYFFNKKNQNFSYPTINLSKFSFLSSFTSHWFLTTLKIVSVFLFFLTILTGSSYSYFNMTLFWIIFALGLTYSTIFIGNIYAFINPWKVLIEWFGVTKEEGTVKYPKSLGYYPALLFYFLFIWIELLGKSSPVELSIVLVLYTVVNVLGVIFFGKKSWFHYCEFFSVFFRLIGKIAPIEYRSEKLYLRPPFIGLLREKAEHFSLLIFTIFMLSSTAFDGFKETLPWVNFYWGHLDAILRPVFESNSYAIFQTVGLLIFPFIFLCIYLLLISLAKVVSKNTLSIYDLSLQFAFSLVPIAVVYNIAHYYTLIFTEGPSIIRLISDPFGFGWNLFNTANYYNTIILNANFIWNSQVAFILLGHIVAVYLAHLVALNVFASNKRALLSQFPMLVLMVAFTMIGLWILSQPITGGAL